MFLLRFLFYFFNFWISDFQLRAHCLIFFLTPPPKRYQFKMMKCISYLAPSSHSHSLPAYSYFHNSFLFLQALPIAY